MKKIYTNNGFTIVEVIVAVFILTMSITAMLSLTASNIVNARYASNEITANYLAQEAIDYIRNSRDTIAYKQNLDKTSAERWTIFINKFGNTGEKCFSENGCDINIKDFNTANENGMEIIDCYKKCPSLSFIDDKINKFYYYHDTGEKTSHFNRKITMIKNSPDEVEVSVSVTYVLGLVKKEILLKTYLLNWQ